MIAGFVGSRADFDKSAVNWIGQGLQTLATFMLLMSAVDLNKKNESRRYFNDFLESV